MPPGSSTVAAANCSIKMSSYKEEIMMNDTKEFEIENGVLKRYTGPGGDVVIPDGVTSIGDQAFYLCGKMFR